MKNAITSKLLIFSSLSIFFSFTANAQTVEEYFSMEGNQVNSYHFNFFDGTWSTSMTYEAKEEINGETYLRYVSNVSGSNNYFKVDGDKIYYFYPSSDYTFLIFDFGADIGDTFTEGIYTNYTLISKELTTLLNGEQRLIYTVSNGFWERMLIPGIGDIEAGILPNFNDFEGGDVFVCASAGGELLYINEQEEGACEEYSCVYPIIDFEMESSDFTIDITDNSRYGTTYLWDFGDGNTSTEANPSHTYENPGCYKVKLTLSNACAENERELTKIASVCTNAAWNQDYENDSLSTIKVFKLNEEIEYLYSNTILYKTNDGGNTWTELTTKAAEGDDRNILTLKMWDENRGIAGANNFNQTEDKRSILVTQDGGQSWTAMVPESYWISSLVLGENGEAWVSAGGYRNYYHRTLDYGLTWETIEFQQGNQIWHMSYADENIIHAEGFDGVQPQGDYVHAVSTDNGESWDFYVKPYGVNRISFVNATTGYGARNDGTVYETNDGGETWSKIDGLTDIATVSFHSPTHGWYTDSDDLVYYTEDKFATAQISNCGLGRINDITPMNDSTAYGYYKTATAVWVNSPGNAKVTFNKGDLGDCMMIVDEDGDGHAADVDCDDSNPDINPDAEEIPYNGIDEDCDASTLDDDLDQDGFTADVDCDDNNADINPDTEEIPYNGIDEDCDASTLDDDLDQDGFTADVDCDDNNADINPDAEEIENNGIDEDCDGADLSTSTNNIATSNYLLYPNPATDRLFIKNGVGADITIYDSLGALIWNGNLQEGGLNIAQLANGVYLISISNEGVTETKRFVKI